MQSSSIYAPFVFSAEHQNDLSPPYPDTYSSYFQTTSYASQPVSLLPDPVPRIPCRWGGKCTILLDDVSAAGIMRHLKEYHLDTPEHPWNKKSRGVCQWDSSCGREMAYASYGKHVAAVHLRSGVQCPRCHKDVGRPGLLERHIRDYCPQAQCFTFSPFVT
ncbi:hypothetical protein B0H21DRAFT_50284 [Amylocystis lapponica]|nr:hypothetical protein B0H21DRAFT_50284 [Amylocystis lapponica]